MAAAVVVGKASGPTTVVNHSISEYDPQKDLGCTEAQDGTFYWVRSQKLRTS